MTASHSSSPWIEVATAWEASKRDGIIPWQLPVGQKKPNLCKAWQATEEGMNIGHSESRCNPNGALALVELVRIDTASECIWKKKNKKQKKGEASN